VGRFEAGTSVSVERSLGYHSKFKNDLTRLLTGAKTVLGGQFDWGGRLPKSNGGAPSYPQHGWKSCFECKGIRMVNCETYKSSRYESRA
jgi:hypothetical protein